MRTYAVMCRCRTMAIPSIAMIFRCLYILTVILQTAPAKGYEDCDIFHMTCSSSTPSNTPVVSTTLETTAPTLNSSTAVTPTNATVSATEVGSTLLSTTASPSICCGCSESCEKCFSPGEGYCTECSPGYIVEPEDGQKMCLPCSLKCYYVCQDTNNKCACIGEKKECMNCRMNDSKHGRCRETTFLDKIDRGGLVGICVGGVLVIILVFVVSCCVFRKLKKPPQPVLDSHQHFSDFSSDGEPMAFENQAVDDDVYGNVDNRGNMLMLNMPDERQLKQPDLVRSPSRPAPLPPGKVSSAPDFGNVYANTVISPRGETTPMSNFQPTVQAFGAGTEQSDFGGLYTNTEIPSSEAGDSNTKFLPKKKPPMELTIPPLPQKVLQDRSPARPCLPKVPQDYSTSPEISQDNQPAAPVILPQLPERKFERSDSQDFPERPPPPPPSKMSLLGRNVMPQQTAPPVQSKKFSSLHDAALHSRNEASEKFSDLSPQPPLVPSPAHKVKSGPTTKKKPPTPTKKKEIVRHIDDEGNLRGEVRIGQPPASVPHLKQTPQDFGGMYEVTAPQPQQDYGREYEVTDVQQDHGGEYAVADVQQDYGGDYEVTDITSQGSLQRDYGMSYEQVRAPPSVPQVQAGDWGEEYEQVEVPSQVPDYGDSYEVMQLPKQHREDISQRKPMPLPNAPIPPPTKQKPSKTQVYEDANKPTPLWTDTNVANPANSGQNLKPTFRSPPALPKKFPIVKKKEDFYDQALQLDTGEGKAELTLATDDDNFYQNNPSVSRYRNVSPKQASSSAPAKSGSYITIQKP
ncbi:titin-like isoform X2 [Acanthaster planci]|uniref:Titin-like isoform X2 n=1 Tax=Acanthaster planci TaxID=133434 RepID=A0A8B7ZPP8_ACAPL|nr:titin-like isoform X2 [Acanthaster planci]